MSRLTSLYLGSTDVNDSSYIVESWDLPDAVLKDAAAAADEAGISYTGQRYENAPWTITWIVRGTSADTTASGVNCLSRLLFAGQTMTINEEDQSEPLVCTVRSVRTQPAAYFGGAAARFTATGTRDPLWTTNSPTIVADASCNLPGTYTASAANITGEVPAGFILKVRPQQATSAIWVGCRSDADSCASFFQDYSGCSDAAAFGTETTHLTASSGYGTWAGATSLNASAMRGTYRVVARVKQPDVVADSAYRAASIATPGAGSATTQYSTHTHATACATFQTLSMGDVDVPAAALIADVGWATPTVYATASGQNASAALTSCAYYAQTFTVSGTSRLNSLYFRVSGSAAGRPGDPTDLAIAYLYSTSGGVPEALLASTPHFNPKISGSAAWWAENTFIGGYVDTCAGTYAAVVKFVPAAESAKVYYNSSAGASGTMYTSTNGTSWSASGADLAFQVDGMAMGVSSSCSVAIQGSNASAVVLDLDDVALIPTDEWAVEATSSFSASAGMRLDASSPRLQDTRTDQCTASATGGSLMGSTKFWGAPGLEPGVDNTLVMIAATPGDAVPASAVVSLEVYPHYLHRMKGD